MRPRILMVGGFPPPGRSAVGGIVTSCRVLIESSLPERAELTLLDSTQVSNPPPGLLTRTILAVRRFASYVALIERARPDAVVLFTSVGASVVEKGAMSWYARVRGVTSCVFPRGGGLLLAVERSALVRAWTRVLLGGAEVIFCQGPAWQRFARQVLRIPEARAPVVHNWTATPRLLDIGRRRQPRLQGPVRLLFVGWVEREKGIFELLDACRALATRHTFDLEVVGDGAAMSAFRMAVEDAGLGRMVHCAGWLDPAGVARALAAADVFVLPSWAEGLPNAMIEAMAARLPLVVSAVGAIPDFITDGMEGFVVPPRDTAALTTALGRVLADRALRDRMGQAALELAEREFGVEPAVDRMLACLASIPAGSAGTARDG